MTPFRTRVLYSESGVFQNISTNQIISNNLLYLSGDQSIGGVKSFEQRPIVSGNAVLLSGDIDLSNFYTNDNPSGFIAGIENLVYTTGDQNISGVKNFSQRPTVNGTEVLLSGEIQSNTIISGIVYSAQVNIKNDHGSTIYKGQPVYIKGANGGNILVGLASNTGEATSSKTLGLVVQDSLVQNASGTVITDGLLKNFDTSSAVAGDPIWLGPTGSLIYGLSNKPYAPNHLVYLGVVTRAQNNGEIFVKVQNGYELEELHNVEVTGALSGQFLVKKNGSWAGKTATISDVSGLQLSLDSKQVTGNYYLDSNPSGYITGVDTSSFYTNDNPSGFITGVNLSSYVTSAETGEFYPASNPSGFITGVDTSLLYPRSNPSGYITGVSQFNYASGDLTGSLLSPIISKINGNAISTDSPASGQALQWNGSAWAPSNILTAESTNVQIFTSSATWTKPAGAKSVHIIVIGAGGGGASGRVTAGSHGGGAGAGGGLTERTIPATSLGSTETVTVGLSGAGGTSQTLINSGNGVGSAGGNSTFGLFVIAGGGGGAGATATAGSASIRALWVGVAGSSGGSNAAGGGGAISFNGAAGGGGGGGQDGANPPVNQFDGGLGGCVLANLISGGQISQGVAPGGNGTNASATISYVHAGNGGGGGASNKAGNGGRGGSGGLYGGGGGGGGACAFGYSSGAGGNGANGIVVVTTYF